MLTRDFDYDLPESAIADRPAPRGESRLLVVDRDGPERHRRVRDLPALLEPGDLAVLNDTRVIPARLYGQLRSEVERADERGETSGRIELLLVEKTGEREWEVLGKPGRKLRPGTALEFETGLAAEVVGRSGDGRYRIRFSEPVEPHLERIGHVPLPPYIKRPDEAADRERYQTVFARHPGAIAAPTAGLHLSAALLAELAARGVEVAHVTLHVGIGTFKPVTAELVHEHRMDTERYTVPEETAAAWARARGRGARVLAVGTTVVRTLETAALAGEGEVRAGSGSTGIFITPGFRFQAVDRLLTNFHLPRSTLLMLVAAFIGRERALAAYREAIAAGYRFYSYGDAMLAHRRDAART
jgi:S-adenosylmethionine:tRNA ribosyltransferase-isomerase